MQFQSAPASLRRENALVFSQRVSADPFQSAPASLRRENRVSLRLTRVTEAVSIRSRLFEAGELDGYTYSPGDVMVSIRSRLFEAGEL